MTHSYASFGKRVAATLIDWLLLSLLTGVISYFACGSFTGTEAFRSTSNTVFFAAYFLYSLAFELSSGATPGKRLMKIHICTLDHSRMKVPHFILRFFTRWLSFFFAGFGCVMVLFTEKRQGMHDVAARTIVINTP